MNSPEEIQEKELTAQWILGHSSALEQFGRRLRELAGRAFANDEDTNAAIYRQIAGVAEGEARSFRDQYDKMKIEVEALKSTET